MPNGQEISESGALWDSCSKNPGHEEFIPVHEFTGKHLARGMNDELFCEELHVLADLVVRFRVQWTSVHRPDGDSYSEYRGTNRLRCGSGYVECSTLSGPKQGQPEMPGVTKSTVGGNIAKNYWTFMVSTASHVVYDTEEANYTKIDFFYDNDESCVLKGSMKTVRPIKVVQSSPKADVCQVLCATDDKSLAKRIKAIDKYLRAHRLIYHKGMRNIVPNFIIKGLYSSSANAIIISHPHGQPKKITVGRVVHSVGGLTFKYKAATCPGSSGAPLFLVDTLYFPPWLGHTHTGSLSQTPTEQINYCNSLGYFL
ncbi:hypothetical protein ElyMa_006028800 [Elysia marginata]|uniref:Peptidase S1 domain-containing protein n=1 Tax=Elysia marginata TaxID=1093978 RepID=A0AAV4GIW6_9GAST|nr:hypothetical protein ElyMa_006028800 [Elysia marginata]